MLAKTEHRGVAGIRYTRGLRLFEASQHWFVTSVAYLMLLFAAAKLVSSLQGVPAGRLLDPVTGIRTDRLIFAAGLFEAALAFYLAGADRSRRKVVVIAAAAFGLSCYRMALHLEAPTRSCNCLGRVSEWVGLSEAQIGLAAGAFLVYMSIGSLVLLCVGFLRHDKSEAGKSQQT